MPSPGAWSPAAHHRLSLAVSITFATFAACLSGACVDPQSDYENWLTRTTDARAGGPILVEASFEAGLPEGGFQQTYLMACASQLANNAVSKANIFVSTLTYTPSGGSGQSGTLTASNHSLVVGATDMSQTVGTPGIGTCTVSADGRCDMLFGPSTIPGAADPVVPGQDIVFTSSALHYVLSSETQLCADLSGSVTSPLNFTFDPSKNVCIFVVPEGGAGGAVPDISGDNALVQPGACPYP
jgi:hypothetical protein